MPRASLPPRRRWVCTQPCRSAVPEHPERAGLWVQTHRQGESRRLPASALRAKGSEGCSSIGKPAGHVAHSAKREGVLHPLRPKSAPIRSTLHEGQRPGGLTRTRLYGSTSTRARSSGTSEPSSEAASMLTLARDGPRSPPSPSTKVLSSASSTCGPSQPICSDLDVDWPDRRVVERKVLAPVTRRSDPTLEAAAWALAQSS